MSASYGTCDCPQCRSALGTAGSGAVAASGTSYIDALLADGGSYRWNASLGAAVSVSYSFLTSLPAVYSGIGAEEAQGFTAFNTAQMTAARTALALCAEVANVTFTETTGSLGEIRFGTATSSLSASAWAYYPGTEMGGDVWLNNRYARNASPSVNSYAFTTVLHEIGHALGLKHPGNYNATGGGTEGPYLPTAEDSFQYTVMSYNSHPTVTEVNPRTQMLYDIAAIQYLYGANTATRSGNTTYAWTAGESFLEALWDGGGTDTIDASNQSTAQTIDLRAGMFSSIAGQSNNLAIAYGVVIENAIGGSGNDTLTGNSAANWLQGGDGNDALDGGGGNDTLDGGAGLDWVTLGDAGGTVTVIGAETLRGGAGADAVTLGGSGNTVLLARIETLTGSAGGDWVTLTDLGSTMTVSGVETLRGGAGIDVITLGGVGNTLILSAIDALTGSAGGDWVTISALGSTMTVSGVETLRGGTGIDIVTLGGVGNTLILAVIDTLTGSAGGDWVTISALGSTMTVSGVETLRGGVGSDIIRLGNGGNTLIVAGLEELTGGAGADLVTLSHIGHSMSVSAVETLVGGLGSEWITLGAGGNTMTVSGVETLRGGAGNDVITLGDAGNSVLLARIETLIGGAGSDWVTLTDLGCTMTVSGIETLRGGAGLDVVTLGGGGIILAAIDTLFGSAGIDFVTLSNLGATTLVSGTESLTGGAAADSVTVSGGNIRFQGNGGADTLTLQAGAGTDSVVFADTEDGGAFGAGTGFDTVTNFQTAADGIVITGALRTAADDDGNGTLTAATRTAGTVNLSSDELVVVTTAASPLDDADLATLRTALGTLAGTVAGADVLVLASNGVSSGLYYVIDSNGNGSLAAGEVRLLAKFSGTPGLGAGNLSLG